MKLLAKRTMPAKMCYTQMVYCSPGIIAAVCNSTLLFLDAGDGHVVAEVREAHEGGLVSVAAQLEADEMPRVASVGVDGRIRLWRLPEVVESG